MLAWIKHFITRAKLIRLAKRELRFGADMEDYLNNSLRDVSLANVTKLIQIIESSPRYSITRRFTAQAFITIVESCNPCARFTVIAEHFDYAQEVGWKDPSAAMGAIVKTAGMLSLDSAQQRALIKLDISRYDSRNNEPVDSLYNYSYAPAFRAAALKRPGDIDRIIIIAQDNPAMDRVEEIEALLDGTVAQPLSGGVL